MTDCGNRQRHGNCGDNIVRLFFPLFSFSLSLRASDLLCKRSLRCGRADDWADFISLFFFFPPSPFFFFLFLLSTSWKERWTWRLTGGAPFISPPFPLPFLFRIHEGGLKGPWMTRSRCLFFVFFFLSFFSFSQYRLQTRVNSDDWIYIKSGPTSLPLLPLPFSFFFSPRLEVGKGVVVERSRYARPWVVFFLPPLRSQINAEDLVIHGRSNHHSFLSPSLFSLAPNVQALQRQHRRRAVLFSSFPFPSLLFFFTPKGRESWLPLPSPPPLPFFFFSWMKKKDRIFGAPPPFSLLLFSRVLFQWLQADSFTFLLSLCLFPPFFPS